MQSMSTRIVVLGTGGTIAGTAADAHDNVGYRSAQLHVQALVDASGGVAAAAVAVETEQVAQLDSADMDHATWQQLARAVARHLGRDEVAGIVITHGTDTLEETAWFLQRVLAPHKPVVLTAAMRPATSLQADGPQNLADALLVAAGGDGARGVVAVIAGQIFAAADVSKRHSHRLDAFEAGDAGPIAVVEEGRVRRFRDWPQGPGGRGLDAIAADPASWPWVEIVTSHAGARGDAVAALVAEGVQGLVVAGTGNGTVHAELLTALREAAAQGVAVRLASRCGAGPVFGTAGWPSYGTLGPYKSRIELMLELMAQP